jgi:molecular chaperone DnaK
MRNQAETLLYTTEQALDSYADLIDADRLSGVRAEALMLKELLSGGAPLDTLREAYGRLETATFELAEAMYGTQDGGTQDG